ncbi:MAG: prepilin-type N-terminal cleavage/methylation domain-containing protein [Saccharofermentans sp.]|nr:prepilin-type N-terminal cleavage/methylation domain-containing protein [Saccharofermentans sp.]
MKKINRNKKGFTLAELLVVVAIIGVLVGVSIPIFTSQLAKSRQATNMANLRAAKAAAISEYMTNSRTGDYTYTYDVEQGTVTGVEGGRAGSITAIDETVDSTQVYATITVHITGEGIASMSMS